ncbi:amidohydrolase family protein [Pseudarthrobacter sp. P1]|uniref:amidohydrolase family protein n=1 Tax=Pseudarthrobacter sp. P1 TaxID=3418418 RepID=UPI003CEE0CA2
MNHPVDRETTATTLIENLQFIVTANRSDEVIRNAAVLIRDGVIADIGPTWEVHARLAGASVDKTIDGSMLGMTPGFIDTHVHLSETLSRAVFPDVLATRAWVFHWAKPFYAHVDEADERTSVLLGTAEMLRSGTTCFLDMGAQNDAGLTARAAGQIGIRGIVGRHAADIRPTEIPAGWSDEMMDHHFFKNSTVALDALKSSVEQWNGYADGRIRCWVNIEGKEPCSLDLHIGARELAAELGVGTTYHIATSMEEAQVSQKRHGVWPISRIARNGGLGSNLVLAHAVAVADEEVKMLADHHTSVAFCPSSSLKLAKGAADIGKYPEMIEAGVTVGLGTDGVSAAGNLNLHRQIHIVAGLFKDARRDATLVGARQAIRMATIDGAKALGWDDAIGSLEVGKQADLVLFDMNHHEWTPYADPEQALVYSASTASIAQTWVAGKAVFKDGRVTAIDETALRAEARERAARIVSRAGLGIHVPVTTTLYD